MEFNGFRLYSRFYLLFEHKFAVFVYFSCFNDCNEKIIGSTQNTNKRNKQLSVEQYTRATHTHTHTHFLLFNGIFFCRYRWHYLYNPFRINTRIALRLNRIKTEDKQSRSELNQDDTKKKEQILNDQENCFCECCPIKRVSMIDRFYCE